MSEPPAAQVAAMTRDRVDVLGVPVDRVTTEQALERAVHMVAEGRPHHLVTVNPEYVMAARRSPEFMSVLRAADLALPDGVGVVWAARLLGRPVPERVSGVDLVPLLVQRVSRAGGSVFLLGAAPGVAEAAAAGLGDRAESVGMPRPRIAGVEVGDPSAHAAPAIIERVRAASPTLLLVAFGAPAQDLWIARHGSELAVPLMMGVGGTFDFLAGVTRRAPAPVRRVGLEWLWRLALEPWRWRRQLALPAFAAAVARARLQRNAARLVV